MCGFRPFDLCFEAAAEQDDVLARPWRRWRQRAWRSVSARPHGCGQAWADQEL